MKSQIDQLLHASLILDATYDEKQLLKAGKLGECAIKVLQRRRKSVQRISWIFMFSLCTPIVIQLIAIMTSSSSLNANLMYTSGSFSGMLLLPGLIELRSSQTRLETLIAMWLLSDHQNSTSDTDQDESELFQQLFTGV